MRLLKTQTPSLLTKAKSRAKLDFEVLVNGHMVYYIEIVIIMAMTNKTR